MRTLKTLIAAAALLILAACGSNNSNTFPEVVITSINPAEVTPGAEVTVTGRNYYSVTGAGSTRIEACGITVNGSLVEPLTRTILLPPGSTITAEVGSAITGTLPQEGFTAGLSDVRVTRPDGSTAVLENAVTCVIPNEEPEPEPEPTPATAAFTASVTSAVAPATINFNAEGSTGEGELAYAWNFGIEEATATGSKVSYKYLEAGTFTVTLIVTDEREQTDTATQTVVVTEPEPTLPVAPEITSFTGPDTTQVGGTATFTWVVTYEESDELTCTLHPGAELDTITIEDCGSGEHEITYEDTGEYTLTLTVTDRHGQETTATHDIQINDASAPQATFTAPADADANDPVEFEWETTYSGLDELTCEFNPGDGSESVALDGCLNGTITHEYRYAGDYQPAFTVQDETNAPVIITSDLVINATGPAPVIDTFELDRIAHNDPAGLETIAVVEIGTQMPSDSTCTLHFGEEDAPAENHSYACSRPDIPFQTTHTYEQFGTYQATLAIRDDYGNYVTETLQIAALNPAAPEITLFTATEQAHIDDPVVFDWDFTRASTIAGNLVTCTFDPGDGSPTESIDSCAPSDIQHEYETADTYTATLMVDDSYNEPVEATHTVNIIDPNAPQILEFEVTSPLTLPASATVTWEFYDPENRVMSCHFYSGIDPDWEIGDPNYSGCSAGHHSGFYYRSYEANNEYKATFMLLDADMNEITRETVDVVVRTPEPPTLSSFTSNAPVDEGEIITFTWSHTYDGHDFVSYCSLDPDDGTGAIPLTDCDIGQYEHQYTSAGTYNPTFTIDDRYNDAVTATHEVVVRPAPPVIDTWDVELAYNDPDGQIITADFDVHGRDATGPVTCSIDFGDNTEPLELGADCVDDTQHTIPYFNYDAGETYDATLTITDTHGNQVAQTIEVNVTNPDAPRAWVNSNNLANGGMPEVLFHLGFRPDSRLDYSLITCTLDPGDGNEADEPTCDPTITNDLIYTYDNPGRYTANFTVEDPYNESVTAEHAIAIRPSPPSISWFTGPEATVVSEAATLTWEIHDWDNSILTCTLDPGGELETITLEECTTGGHDVTYEDTGEYTATLTVIDDYEQEVTATHTIDVHHAPEIASFTGPETALVNEMITLTWVVNYDGSDNLTCSITTSEGATPIDVTADCTTGSISVSYAAAGPVTTILTVSDESNNTITAPHELQVNNALAPEVVTFDSNSPVTHRDPVTFTWEVINPQGDPLNCTFDPDDGTPSVNLTDCDSGTLQHTYPYPDEYKPTFTVTDEHGNTVTDSVNVDLLPTPPVVMSFKASPNPANVNQEVEFDFWAIIYDTTLYTQATCSVDPGDDAPPTSRKSCANWSETHTYSQAGTYTATLIIHEVIGRDTEFTTSVEVP